MMATQGQDDGARRRRYLRIHLISFAAASVVLLALDLATSDTRWFHWPVMAWGAFFCVHALYCKSLSVDDDWADKRTDRIRGKSYDLGHIQDIEDSYKKDQSVEDTVPERRG